MPDPALPEKWKLDAQATAWFTRKFSTTTEHARTVLDGFRTEQREIQAQRTQRSEDQAQRVQLPTAPQVQTSPPVQFNPQPFTLALNRTPQNENNSAPTVNGIDAQIIVCVDDGMGGFSQKTATFSAGLLVDIS